MNTKVFSLKNSREIGKKITNIDLMTTKQFSDGEIKVEIEESVRSNRVFVIGSLTTSDDIIELMMVGDALRRASAKEIIAVVPYLAYMRQDRKDKPRTAIGSKVMANMIEIYYDQIITMDLHSTQIEGFFNIPVTHINCATIFEIYIRKNFDLSNVIIVSPDVGGAKRAKKLSSKMGLPLAIINKERKIANEISSMELIGDVNGKDVIILDDMVDTAGSLCKASDLLIENGANKVWGCATHGVLSGEAHNRILNSSLEKLICTDTIKIKDNEKIEILSCSDLIKKTIETIESGNSINSLVNDETFLVN